MRYDTVPPRNTHVSLSRSHVPPVGCVVRPDLPPRQSNHAHPALRPAILHRPLRKHLLSRYPVRDRILVPQRRARQALLHLPRLRLRRLHGLGLSHGRRVQPRRPARFPWMAVAIHHRRRHLSPHSRRLLLLSPRRARDDQSMVLHRGREAHRPKAHGARRPRQPPALHLRQDQAHPHLLAHLDALPPVHRLQQRHRRHVPAHVPYVSPSFPFPPFSPPTIPAHN